MENKQQDKKDNNRFERKYILDKNCSWIFKDFLIRKNFFNKFEKRKVNSIYFDTKNFSYLIDNLDGVSNRLKVRLRWYDQIGSTLNLELKKKTGFVGWKEVYNFGKFISVNEVFKLINSGKFTNIVCNLTKKNLQPVLQTSYLREYYMNYFYKLRSTIDTNLEFRSIKNYNFNICHNKEILEFKYDRKYDDDYRNLIFERKFKFRLQKFSKYVIGISILKRNFLV